MNDVSVNSILDDIAQIAITVCTAKVAIITLIEKKKYWIKSHGGIVDADSLSYFASWINSIEPSSSFIISNTDLDPVYKSNPLVTSGPKIKFCAGTPIITLEGQVLGVICVIDFVPKNITENKLIILKHLAEIAVTVFESNRNLKLLGLPEKEVSTFGRLMPICFNCKSLRTDQGDWQLLEKFIEAELGIKFSHGVCEKCSESIG